MVKKKIIVIGAGPAGLTAAYKLTQSGCDVDVFEAAAYVGGLARSFELWGQTVDCGPHRFFSNDKIVNDFFMEVVKDDYISINRLTRIYYNNKFFNYPLKISNVLLNIGPLGVLKILSSYCIQKLRPIKNPKTFEEWVINKFGRKLFNIFFKNYSEKLWGIPCSRIDADWAAQRIKNFSLFEAVKATVFDNNKHKTLVDQFSYPMNGTGSIYTKMAAYIEQNGGKVWLKSPVERILLNGQNEVKGVKLVSGEEKIADEVISTMPLTLMVKGLTTVPEEVNQACNSLFFRNTILVYLEIDDIDIFPDNWIYVHSPTVLHGRVTNFRNWSPKLYKDRKTTILCLEYWCFDKDEIWQAAPDYFAQLAEKELRELTLLKQSMKVLNTQVVKLPKCYPVYETGYKVYIKLIKDYLDSFKNLRVIGRYGSFKYNNQDHSMLMGLLAAREIISGQKENLWDINTDSEYHEEGAALNVKTVL